LRDSSNNASRERLRGKRDVLLRVRSLFNKAARDEITLLKQQRFLAKLEFERLVEYSRAIRLLGLEAKFYHERAKTNFRFYKLIGAENPRSEEEDHKAKDPVAELHTAIADYRSDVKNWDNELKDVLGWQLFRSKRLEAQRLRNLSKKFG